MRDDGDVAQGPEELHRRAVELCIHGRYAMATRVLDRAWEATSDPDLRARITGTRAVILQHAGRSEEAEQICRDAVAQQGLRPHTRAVLLGQLGTLAMLGGRLEEAHTRLGHAIQGLDGDDVAAARLRMNRSVVSLQLRRLDDAAADLEVAATTFAAHALPVDEGQAQHNRAYIQLLRGDLVQALAEMAEARAVLPGSAVVGAVADVDRAEVLREAGLATEAERILERAASVFGAHRMPGARAEAELQLARSLLNHDPARARRVASAAARRFRAAGNDAWTARADALRLRAELGDASTPGNTLSAAPAPVRTPREAEVEEVAAVLEAHRLRTEAAGLRMSYELWRARRGAPRTMRAARVPAGASMDVRLLAHQVRVAHALAGRREARARQHAAEGLDILGRWQDGFGSIDLQTSIAMHGNGLIFAGLASAARSGRPDVLFEWSERARHLSQQVVPLRPPPDPALAADLAELRMLRADGDDWRASPRAVQIRQRARERQWAATGSTAFQERASLDELRAGIGDAAAFVSYVFTGPALLALVVVGGGARIVALDRWPVVRQALPGLRADLDMSASVRTGPLADAIRRSLDERLAALSAALLDDVVEVAGDRTIVVTAPGVLNGIPWAMLPAMKGRPFTVAPSATRWLRAHEQPSPPAREVGFAVGPRVARGAEEVDTAAASWAGGARPPARVLHRATVDDVADLAGDVDVLHIAAHGRHAVDNPLFSGLEMSDGTLFGYDIDRMSRVPATVVLSACEGGRSSVRWGEEAVGMTRIWLHAGVRCVVATPVIIADDVACELLGAMHAGLAAGQPPAVALAEASARTGIVAPFQSHGAGF